mmetsp:Transcript_42611/g.79466  ORF Transcript_42611/g.79466 Transcript_42611/m.79466 type:complete len:120 (+) Transcript_42611:72-431(+)
MNPMWTIVVLAMGSMTAQGRTCDTTKCPPQHTHVDFRGYDLTLGCGQYTRVIASIESYLDCCALCQGDDECGSFTWNDANICYLKSSDGPHGATGNPNSYSGDMSEAPGAPKTSPLVQV